jgi:capsular polysaccharide biosynthesis protein
VSNVTILQGATFISDPVSPKKGRNFMAAIFAGIFISLAFAFLREYFDQSLKSNQDVEKRLGLPVLASVSHEEFRKCI